MQMSECCDPFRRRRIVNFKRRLSSGGEEEIEAENKSGEQGPNRSGDTAPSFLDRANFRPRQDRRSLQLFYMEGAYALPRIARGTHGCIRLANWDVARLATKIKTGDNVSIH